MKRLLVSIFILLLLSRAEAATPTVLGMAGSSQSNVAQQMGQRSLLGVLKGANFNSTSDQSITINTPDGPIGGSNTKFVITDIWVTNCSLSMTTAAGGFYSAASKGGTAIVASGQTYTSCQGASGTNALQEATIATAGLGYVFAAATTTVYLSLTSAQGATATADVYVFGIPLP